MSHGLKKVVKSATLLINEQSKNLENSGNKIFKFGFGQSPFSPPKHIVEELKNNCQQHYYSPVQGIAELRQAVADFHKNDFDTDAENIFIAPGSKILIYAVMCSYQKANILIPSPSWVSYAPQARLCGHNIFRLETNFDSRWRISPEQLENILKKKKSEANILILNYPGNPDGLTYNKEELKEIAYILQKYECLVISDEIYGLLDHNGKHISIAKLYPEGSLITTGLSKWCGAGGWRLGALSLPKKQYELKETLLGVASETYSCNSTPVQLAAISAYQRSPKINDFIKHERRLLKLIGNHFADTLINAGIDVHHPEGGFYLFPYLEKLKEDFFKKGLNNINDICKAALNEANIAILPSTAFGFDENMLAFRLSYTDFDGNIALRESQKVGLDNQLTTEFAEEFMKKTCLGARKLADWIKSV